MTTRFYTRKVERHDDSRLAQTLNNLYDDVQRLDDELDYYKGQAELYKAHYDMTCGHLLETMDELDKYKSALKIVYKCLDNVAEFYSERDGELVYGHYAPAWRVMDELGL